MSQVPVRSVRRALSYCEDFGMIVFFFQAEDGIRDYKVTGVQTCALPIYTLTPMTCSGESSGRCWSAASTAASSSASPSPTDAASENQRSGGCTGSWSKREIGRAACRGRGEISGGGGSFKKKKKEI